VRPREVGTGEPCRLWTRVAISIAKTDTYVDILLFHRTENFDRLMPGSVLQADVEHPTVPGRTRPHHQDDRTRRATAIVPDALMVPTVLNTAVMHSLGKANWYFPRGLDRRLSALTPRGQQGGPAQGRDSEEGETGPESTWPGSRRAHGTWPGDSSLAQFLSGLHRKIEGWSGSWS
jgi:hypothetical protein